MKKQISRRGFFHQGLLTSGFLLTSGVLTRATARDTFDTQEKPPPLSPELVKDFVISGHRDLEKVKEMLGAHPTLLNAAWDWSNGDFETALEGAGHMGRKDIAEYLISKGARTNIFVLTMLGKTTIVKSLLTDFPSVLRSWGPHGFTLLHHAEKGGKEAEELFQYVQELGLTEKNLKLG